MNFLLGVGGAAGGRGHFEIAGEYQYQDGLLPRYPVAGQHTAQPNIGGRTIARQSGQISYGSDAATVTASGSTCAGAAATPWLSFQAM